MSTIQAKPSRDRSDSRSPVIGHLQGYVLLVLTAVFGCSGSDESAVPRADVSGTVTLNGKPLESGTVRFIPIDGTIGPKATANVQAGQFALPTEFGPVVGRHRVEIVSSDTGGLAMDDEEALERLQAQARRPRIEVVRVPPAYNKRSTLTADISVETPNELSFKLVSKAR